MDANTTMALTVLACTLIATAAMFGVAIVMLRVLKSLTDIMRSLDPDETTESFDGIRPEDDGEPVSQDSEGELPENS